MVAIAVPAPTGVPTARAVSTPAPVGAEPAAAGAGTAAPPPAALSRLPSEPVAGADAAAPSCTTPAIGARRVSASTVDLARLYADCACARWASPRAPSADDRLATLARTAATAARAVAARAAYCAGAAWVCASSAERTAG